MKIHEALFSDSRAKILALLLLNPNKQYFLREITRKTGNGLGSVQRELDRLVKARLLRSKRKDNKLYYCANQDNLAYKPLRDLINVTLGPLGQLSKTLKPLADTIEVAFIYGSFATFTANDQSDIDVMLIGTVDYDEAVFQLSKLEDKLGREINPAIFHREEFQDKYSKGNAYLKNVVKNPKLFIIGGDDDLNRLVQCRMVA